jgi:HNH endonuclease
MSKSITPPLERFWKRVDKQGIKQPWMDSCCWKWRTRGKVTSLEIKIDKKHIIKVPLFVYRALVSSDIPVDKYVCHRCRNKTCINPEHLYLGTREESLNTIYTQDGITYKVCTKCKKSFPYTGEYFYTCRHVSSTVPYQPRCISCAREKSRIGRAKYWYNALWVESRNGAKHRRKHLEFSISKQDILDLWDKQGGKCYWYGIPMIPSSISKYPFKPSLDRLDENRGYTKDNIVLCCLAANFGRNSNSKQEYEEFVNTLIEKGIDKSLWRKL